MKALVTGASGFIGSHLIDFLHKNDVDTLKVRHWDLELQKGLVQIADDKFDLMFHLASFGNIHNQTGNNGIFQANLGNLLNLLQITKGIRYKAFINISTSSVTLPHQTMYSATKAAGEKLIEAYRDEYQKPIINVRPYTVIGPGEQKEHLIPTLIDAAFTGKTISFVPDATHDYLDVRDTVDALWTLANSMDKLTDSTYEIGNGVAITNGHVKEIVELATDRRIKTDIKESLRPYDNPFWRCEDPRLRDLGWKPKYSLTDTIYDMVKEYEIQAA